MFCNSIKTQPPSFNKPTNSEQTTLTHSSSGPSPAKRKNKAPEGDDHPQRGQNHVHHSNQPMKTQENSHKSKIDISTRIIDRSSSSSTCNPICNRFATTSSPALHHNDRETSPRQISSHTPSYSREPTLTTLQRAAFRDLILNHNMANNNTLHTVYDLPVKQRNPHPRGTRKYTRRANINRNIRAHLRHDRQRTQNDGSQLQRMQEEHDKHNETVESIHLRFYSAINHFQDWDDSRHQIEYDQVLIFRWTQIYGAAQNLILDATKGKFRLIEDPTLYQMTHLLWTKAQHMKPLASHGTLSHTSYRWATPTIV